MSLGRLKGGTSSQNQIRLHITRQQSRRVTERKKKIEAVRDILRTFKGPFYFLLYFFFIFLSPVSFET